ncbi:M56 family metallopeptidase [Pseudonocardia acaciae]|uniref:M56 family metallopeptidase n=1 Tax=Pseudonocardia acaciae TaxID=551276 RepID=UPI00048AA964|nr:M56 family metallopeptidase [Pseudonocardia acaciae]
MTVSVAMVLGAALVGSCPPARLRRLPASRIDPSALIVAWLLTTAGVLGTAGAGVALLLVPDHGVPSGLLSAAGGCWSAVTHGASPDVEQVTGVLGLLVLLSAAVNVVLIGSRVAARRARARRERVAVLRLAARTEPGSPEVLWLAHDRPLAFAMPGRPSYLVATEGLGRHLTPAQAGAVLAHERAHLRGRHHLLVALADVLAAGLPFLPLFGAAPAAVRELVELSADAEAARRCGAGVVRSALVRVAGGAPGASLAFGEDALEPRLARLERLAADARPVTRVRRGLARGVAGGSVLLPALAAAALFAATSTLYCSGL